MTKKQLTKRILLTLALGLPALLPTAHALPDQGNYDNSGYVSIAINGNVMNITGKYVSNIINWNTFSIASGETVKFTDKNNYLNLVNGFDTSRIYGTISGGGHIYLINPYGILFGAGATLENVGHFIASTRDISDVDQESFIWYPERVENVLYANKHESRNKDYFPDNSPFVPTISVAELNLTNVPNPATRIILDSPGGIILKDTTVFDKMALMITNENGGEIGIGSNDGTVNLTKEQKKNITLLGDASSNFSWKDFNDKPNIVKGYKLIHNVDELQAINQDIKVDPDVPKRYMLANDIDAKGSSGNQFKSLGSDNVLHRRGVNGEATEKGFHGTFDGLGFKIYDIYEPQCDLPPGGQGLFSSFSGTLRNLGVEGSMCGGAIVYDTTPDIWRQHATYNGVSSDSLWRPNLTYPIGGIAAYFSGNMSNVYYKGYLAGQGAVGGLVGIMFLENVNDPPNGIRNSYSSTKIDSLFYGGGIAGRAEGTSFINVYSMSNVERWMDTAGHEAGGIVGIAEDNYNKEARILSAYNYGTVRGSIHAGGIAGVLKIPVGDVYNFGNVITNTGYRVTYDGTQGVGGIAGSSGATPYVSKVTGFPMSSYYKDDVIQNEINLPVIDFGTAMSESILTSIFNENWQKNPATIGVETKVIPNYIVSSEPKTPSTPSNSGTTDTSDDWQPVDTPVTIPATNTPPATATEAITQRQGTNPPNNTTPAQSLKDNKTEMNSMSEEAKAQVENRYTSTPTNTPTTPPVLNEATIQATSDIKTLAEQNGWQPMTAKNTVDAFADASLNTKVNSIEQVSRGDTIAVISETDTAYEVVYHSDSENKNKLRWVSKEDLNKEPARQTYTSTDYSVPPSGLVQWSSENGAYDAKVYEFIDTPKYKDRALWSASQPTTVEGAGSGTGCNAYIRDFVKLVYGITFDRYEREKAGKAYSSIEDVQAGDVIWFNDGYESDSHWLVVLYREGEYLATAEGNWGGTAYVGDYHYRIHDGRLQHRNRENESYGKLSRDRVFYMGFHFP